MASERELNLLIKARDQASKILDKYGKSLKDLEKNIDTIAKAADKMNDVTKATEQMGRSSKYLKDYSSDTYQMYKMQKAASDSMRKEYQKLADSSKKYGGSTKGMLNDIDALGKKHKKIMDSMINDNSRVRASFYEGIGAVQAASKHADESAKAIRRNYGAARALDLAFLGLGSRLEDMAKKGNAARIALQELGPTASMKDLRSLMAHINRQAGAIGLMQLGAAFITGAEIVGLVKLSNIVDGRLIPAFKNFKKTWLEALTPFVKMVTDVFLAVLNFGTAIGQTLKEFSAAHPILSNMALGFLALLPPLFMILAPLSMGLAFWRNYQVMFAKLYTMIRPFVTAFLGVIGTVMLVAAAIVAGIAAWNQMIEHSKKLRTAVDTLKKAFSEMWNGFIKSMMPAWNTLKAAFTNMIQTLTGTDSVGDFWQMVGDRVASIFNWISSTVVPILSAGFQVLGQVISTIFTAAAGVLNKFSAWWTTNGPMIMEKVNMVKEIIFTAFSAVWSFLVSIMPQIQTIIGAAFDFIKTAARALAPVISAVFLVIKTVMTVLWPIIQAVIISAWGNIKAVITSALAIIQNVIQLFSNLLKGNWKAAWENVKAILKNAVILLWNAVQLYFLGKMIGALRSFGTGALSLIKGAWTGIKTIFTTTLNALKALVTKVFNAKKAVINGVMKAIQKVITSILKAIQSAWKSGVNNLKSIATSVFNGIRSVIQGAMAAVRSVITSAVSGIKSVWTAGLNAVKSVAKSAWSAIVSGVKTMGSNIKSAFSSVISGVKSAWSSFVSTATGMGRDLMSGLVNGIKGMAGAVMDAASSVVKGAMDSAKKFLKIKSPSRVMIEVGGFFSEGFANGILDAAKLAKKASTKMTQQAIQPVEARRFPVPQTDMSGSSRAQKQSAGATIQVTIQNVTLPAVKNGQDFVDQVGGFSLQQAFKAQGV